ncbi:MAG: hypothetical protein NC548_47405 [Lachnospiraceae bacterium]|nr:hypothetical protein [Lachnospiraceae bacterium]
MYRVIKASTSIDNVRAQLKDIEVDLVDRFTSIVQSISTSISVRPYDIVDSDKFARCGVHFNIHGADDFAWVQVRYDVLQDKLVSWGSFRRL